MRLPTFLTGLLLAGALAGLCESAAIAQLTQDDFSRRIAEATEELARADARVEVLDPSERMRLTSFVIGNLIFTLDHELGHAVIAELHIPVIGREEDAADQFATLALLYVGSELSHRVLTETAKGLWLMADREKRRGHEPVMYDEHSLDLQRAYQIICMMVGSDRHAFRNVAELAKMPEDRQQSCRPEFEQAVSSWRALLKQHSAPHFDGRSSPLERLLGWRRSTPENHHGRVRVEYGEASQALAGYRSAMLKFGLLELVGGFADRNFSFPRPITLEAMTCKEPDAHWDDRARRLVLCYELASEYLSLALEAPKQ